MKWQIGVVCGSWLSTNHESTLNPRKINWFTFHFSGSCLGGGEGKLMPDPFCWPLSLLHCPCHLPTCSCCILHHHCHHHDLQRQWPGIPSRSSAGCLLRRQQWRKWQRRWQDQLGRWRGQLEGVGAERGRGHPHCQIKMKPQVEENSALCFFFQQNLLLLYACQFCLK